MRDRPHTPHATLLQAHELARRAGLKYVYTGNVDDATHQSTYCPHCKARLIERNWYDIGAYDLKGDRCGRCGGRVAGRFDERPGTWGRRRQPVAIARFADTVGPVPAPAPTPRDVYQIEPGAAMSARPETVAKAKTELSVVDASARGPRRPEPTSEQERQILRAAAEFVTAAILRRSATLPDLSLAGAADLPVAGAYVTLKRQGHLRACCGMLGKPRRLIEALHHSAFITATEDHRLPPISATELPYLDLHVNLLHNPTRLSARGRERVVAVEVGRHGLRIQRGEATGLLLPTVAVEHGWDSEAFLRHVCRKAGLPTTAWDDDETLLLTFESAEFGGPFDATVLGDVVDASADSPIGPAELLALARHARDNLVALVRGMVPNYYVYDVADGNVSGLALTVSSEGEAGAGVEPMHLAELSFRPGLPLQSTLLRLCERAADALRRTHAAVVDAPGSLRVGVTVLTDPALHGTLHASDLRGFEPSRRALVAIENDRNAWIFAPGRLADDLLASLRLGVEGLNPEGAMLVGLSARSTEAEIVIRSAPRPVADDSPRPPAVAGRFYPDDPDELGRLVDDLFGASTRHPERWAAAMVPHAGLVYSGQLAASVFHRLKFPGVVIILGPKHTRLGVNWAVSPHDAWSIPGATIPSDPDLARALVAAIPGLQLDAAAHRQEHAIEVELPFLARLAPHSRVVGVAIGGGDWEHCRRFALGLAEVIRGLPEPPLLLISSDMNHFASDRENRRLDTIALDAMERLDPAGLLETVTSHNISMCGVLPAVIVMEALRQLGGLRRCERVGYATSADVNGDTSRVVGYAGVLLD
jgi:AmmeMemoRadiSam system protein B/uncharacterized protein (TIGR00296 family)